MEKRVILVIGMLLLSFGAVHPWIVNHVEALPGPPMIVYGSINDTGGKNIPSGVSVDAFVHDPIYGDEWFNFTTGLNVTQDVAGYGYMFTGVEFRINDSDPSSRAGNLINFYINEELWGNLTFSAGTIRRDITLVDVPVIVNVSSASTGEANTAYTVNVTATDLFDAPAEMGVKVNWSHGSLSGNTSLSPITGDLFSDSFVLDNVETNLTYTVWVNDSAGNVVSSGPYTITVVSSDEAPEFVTFNNPSNGTAGASFLFNVTVSDAVDAEGDLVVRVNWSHGALGSNTTLSHQGSGVFNGSVTLDDSISNVSFTFWVNDTSSNMNSSGPYYANVSDQTVPVSSVDAVSSYWMNASDNPLVVNATNSDNVGLSNVSLYYYFSEDNVTFSGPFLFGTDTTPWPKASWSFTFGNGSGFYRFYSIAIDNASLSESAPITNDTMCGYDTNASVSEINNRSAGYYQYFLNASLQITASVNTSAETNGSGVSRVGLYYWYMNETNLTGKANGSWLGPFLFGWNATPWLDWDNVSWSFTFGNGSGYYRFSSRSQDNASNLESVDAIGETNATECYFNNSYPNQPTRVGPTGSSVSRTVDLNWTATDPDDNATLRYDVYFGTDATPDASELKASNQTESEYDLGTLSYSTKYYWMIVVWDEHNASNTSDVWSFTTESGGSSSSGSTSGGFIPGDTTAPSAPFNVTYASVVVDTTPSFTWDAATDNEGIAGYYVKIDSGTETSVGDVLTWTSESLEDGTYTLYVRAVDTSGNFGPYESCNFSVDSSVASSMMPVADAGGPYVGYLTLEDVPFSGVDSVDPDGSLVNYTWDFGDNTTGYGMSVVHLYNVSGSFNVTLTVRDDDGLTDDHVIVVEIELDTDGDGWSDELELAYGTGVNNSAQMPLDTDEDGIPDEDSLDGEYSGDPDDDDDGVPDVIEDQLGADKKDGSGVQAVEIEDVTYHLVDTNGDAVFDAVYVGQDTEVWMTYVDGVYLIDTDADGVWDYEYDPAYGDVSQYVAQEGESIPLWMIALAVIAISILVFIIGLFKMGYLYFEDDEQ